MKTRLCKYWSERGFCPHGDTCSFAHSIAELPETHKRELCQSWKMIGVCQHGVNCKYAHGEHELREKFAPPEGMEKGRRNRNTQPPEEKERENVAVGGPGKRCHVLCRRGRILALFLETERPVTLLPTTPPPPRSS